MSKEQKHYYRSNIHKLLGGYILRTGYILWRLNLSGYILWLVTFDASTSPSHIKYFYMLEMGQFTSLIVQTDSWK